MRRNARCSQWEPLATAAPVAVVPRSHSILAEAPLLAFAMPITLEELAPAALRAVLVLIASVFVAIGLAVLTQPLAVPFTVGLWLCAATSLGFAAFGRFSPKP